MDKRTKYIDQLLSELKSFEESVLIIKNNSSLPFSFFKDSFNRTQEIDRLLHNLQFMQVDDMKVQMERLVHILSETEKKEQGREEIREQGLIDRELEIKAQEQELKAREHELNELKAQEQKIKELVIQGQEYQKVEKEQKVEEEPEVFSYNKYGNKYSVGLEFPEYKKPQTNDNYNNPIKESTKKQVAINGNSGKSIIEDKTLTPSINDIIKTPPAIVDLKRGISLNDRFLFQRELFNNNRQNMNESMDKLSTFDTFEEAENFLRNNKVWDFEDPIVLDFLSVIKKGFK